jgi:hypothetical protein
LICSVFWWVLLTKGFAQVTIMFNIMTQLRVQVLLLEGQIARDKIEHDRAIAEKDAVKAGLQQVLQKYLQIINKILDHTAAHATRLSVKQQVNSELQQQILDLLQAPAMSMGSRYGNPPSLLDLDDNNPPRQFVDLIDLETDLKSPEPVRPTKHPLLCNFLTSLRMIKASKQAPHPAL